jgi:hypothetical protein
VVLRHVEPSTRLRAIVLGRVRIERVSASLFATTLLAE